MRTLLEEAADLPGTSARPAPGSHQEDVYRKLLVQQSRAGKAVELDACAQLASLIQEHGHRSEQARQMAKDLGLDPAWLPRQRSDG